MTKLFEGVDFESKESTLVTRGKTQRFGWRVFFFSDFTLEIINQVFLFFRCEKKNEYLLRASVVLKISSLDISLHWLQNRKEQYLGNNYRIAYCIIATIEARLSRGKTATRESAPGSLNFRVGHCIASPSTRQQNVPP